MSTLVSALRVVLVALARPRTGLWIIIRAGRVLLTEGWPGISRRLRTPGLLADREALIVDSAGRLFGKRNEFRILNLATPTGIVPAYRPPKAKDYALEVPFGAPVLAASDALPDRVAGIIHLYYPKLAAEIVAYLAHVPCPVDCYISTDTPEKQRAIEAAFADHRNGSVEVRLTENRGRDVAAKFVAMRDVHDRYEIALYLHSKRTLHGGAAYRDWRPYLLDTLLGSDEIVRSTLHLLRTTNVGIVFPQHYPPVRKLLNWGYNFPRSKALLGAINVKLAKTNLLEFPSGSMFWARTAAFQKLLDLNLQYADFEAEQGQIDGTLAHAVERCMLYFVEAAGFRWAKIALRERYSVKGTVLPVASPDDLEAGLASVYRTLLGSQPAGVTSVQRAIPGMALFSFYPSPITTPRITMIVPTVNPSKMYGGVATAMRIFSQLQDALGDRFDFRIVASDDPILDEARQVLPGYQARSVGSYDPPAHYQLVDASHRQGGELPVRKGEVFIATAWWTAHHVLRLRERQQAYFGCVQPFVYLIQDYEPNFYPWSTRWVLAENTYHKSEDTIALFNSEELYTWFLSRFSFYRSFVLPFELNASIAGRLAPKPRQRNILIYGRPSVARNCFELLVDGIYLWQQHHPLVAQSWNVISVGEDFPSSMVPHLQNFTVRGKLELGDYAELLSESAVGISLMVSPHPSYPPLEMAAAGMIVLTNRYDNKDLACRSERIRVLDELSDTAIFEALAEAVDHAERTHLAEGGGSELRDIEVTGRRYDPQSLAELLTNAVGE